MTSARPLIASNKGSCELFKLFLRPDYHRPREGQERAKSTINQSETILDREVPVFAQKTSHLCDSVYYVSSLGSAIQPHVVANAQKSNGCFPMGHLQRCCVVLNAGRFPRVFALKAGVG